MSQSGLILPASVNGTAGTTPGSRPRLIHAIGLYARDPQLVFAIDATYGRRELVTGGLPTAANIIGGYTGLGPGFQTDATRNGLVYATPPGWSSPNNALTLVVVWSPTLASTGNTQWIIATGTSGDPNLGIHQNTTTLKYGIDDNSSQEAGTLTVGQTVVLIATKNASVFGHRLYIDGVQVAASATTNSGRTPAPIGVGREGASIVNYSSGQASLALAFNRALTQNEVVDLTRRLRRAIPDTERFQPRYLAAGAPVVSSILQRRTLNDFGTHAGGRTMRGDS